MARELRVQLTRTVVNSVSDKNVYVKCILWTLVAKLLNQSSYWNELCGNLVGKHLEIAVYDVCIV